ncbi:hypothetical protein I656_00978 [Geobacillus sp. WSUCF1]|nr:hypothetical protein I656_00978 [Geobacillus sp. WSUCF1]
MCVISMVLDLNGGLALWGRAHGSAWGGAAPRRQMGMGER